LTTITLRHLVAGGAGTVHHINKRPTALQQKPVYCGLWPAGAV